MRNSLFRIAAVAAAVALILVCRPAMAQERIRIAWAGDSPANSPIWVVQEKGLLAKHGLNGEVIRIAWAGDSPANSPIWVVQEKGLLAKHGLNGEVIRISASPTALQAMPAGA